MSDKPFNGARIIFGIRPPKNWKESIRKQKGPEYQRLQELWDTAETHALEAMCKKQMNDYWAKKTG